jgi:hypothetical protein
VINTPIFFFVRDFIIVFISSIDTGSIPVRGSSRSKNFGLAASVLAISNLLLSPPDKTSDLDFFTRLMLNSFNKPCKII